MLVLDVDASGVEVWSLPQAALLRQIRGFHAVGAPPAWDRWSGWWWIPTSTGLVAVDPDYKQPVRELALPDAVVAVLPIGPREVAVMLQRAGGVAVVVLDHAHGAQVGRVVPLPQWQGGRAMAVLHEGL